MTMTSRRLVAATVLAAALTALPACSGNDGNGTTAQKSPTPAGTSASTPGADGGSSAPTTPAAPPTTATADPVVVGVDTTFTTPSRNIRCVFLDAHRVRCDIKGGITTYTPPPRPTTCEADWGTSFEVDGQGAGHLICFSDAVDDGRVLEYGHALRSGPTLCTSTQAALRCENVDTKHGFTLARDRYTLF